MSRLYEIGPFRLDASIGAVTRAGIAETLGARAVAVLTVLVETAPEFVSKQKLIDAAWPGVIVEDSNLAVQIHAIRRVLAQMPGGNRWIGHTLTLLGRTLAKLGKLDDSRSALQEASSLLEDTELPWLRGLCFFNQGFLKSISGNPAGARIDYERSRELFLEAGDDFSAAATQGNLANITWALGDLDATETSFRVQVAFSRTSPMKTKRMLGWSLASLAGVLTERGKIDEALVPGREGLQLLLEDGNAWVFVNHFALRAALAGRHADAARLAGFADYAWSKRETIRHPVDARTHERLDSVLRQQLAAADLERLRAEGAALSETEGCRLALES